MANIDAALRFQLTNPTDKSGKSLVSSTERLYFADICSAPGGFSEYVLWRKKDTARGFGFTLEGGQDFTLEDSRATSSQLFESFYGDACYGKQLREFHHRVMTGTGKTGVHLVMADGDIPVNGREEIQEILYKRLYTSQFLCALMVLRAGGYFVCKMWDTFTPYTVGLIYLMYRAFKHIAIFKPVTSRAETSERYLICHGKKSNCSPICEHLFDVIQSLASNETSDADVMEIVPLSVIQEDPVFCEFIRNNNEIIGIQQRTSLMTIYRFALLKDKPYDPRQSEVRAGCLKAWNIPNNA